MEDRWQHQMVWLAEGGRELEGAKEYLSDGHIGLKINKTASTTKIAQSTSSVRGTYLSAMQ